MWRRQRFGMEIEYYLNFYYVLIYGAFDHAALFVSQLLNMGLPPKQVGATYKVFLELLKKSYPSLHLVFTDGANKEFIDRIGALRHFAAHRGSVTPASVIEKPENEPTIEELDSDIRADGLEEVSNMLPPGEARDRLWEVARSNARWARYQKGTVLEDVVQIEINGKYFFIHPLTDTEWNFSRINAFLSQVFRECSILL
jgi:hypothetical protein